MPLAALAALVRRETGIVLSRRQEETTLRAALQRAAPGLDPAGFMRAVSDPVTGRRLLDRLIDEVTVQESSFLRDRGQLDAIPWLSLMESARAAGSRVIRAWSAGCATGEEPYTLALLAAEAFPSGPPPVDVLGTDISSTALAAAAVGRYRPRAVRELSPAIRDRYLVHETDGSYRATDRLRRVVRFERHNLVTDPVPPPREGGFDLITCRNVLIYFDATVAEDLVGSLMGALRPGGKLLLGAADVLQRNVRIVPPPVAGGQTAGKQAASQQKAPGKGTRRPLGREPDPRGSRITAALAAASRGDRGTAVAQLAPLLISDPLDADAQFAYGLVMLEGGEPKQAVTAFRRALYVQPTFALAAFTLGCAHDALGDTRAARRAYQQALRTLNPADDSHEVVLQQVDIGDIAAACRMRLRRHSDAR
ncbi:MAG: chemotaxis protein methyltransferase CheR [Trebonia sp.]|nr:chemotaxis protein methyltransferase CheR [Trebonia sp.]